VGSEEEVEVDEPILWSNEHSHETPQPLIVAPPVVAAEEEGRTPAGASPPAVSVVNAEVVVTYRPRDLLLYVRANRDALEPPGVRDSRLRCLAHQQVSRYLLREEIDAWIGTARLQAGARLRELIQTAADEARLGIEVLGVSVPSIHPPHPVAEAFHAVVGAEQVKQTTIEEARREGVQVLAEVAGSTELADRIVLEIETAETLRAREQSEAEIEAQEARVEALLLEAGGQAATTIAAARGQRWLREQVERAKAERFASQRAAHDAAPEVYRARAALEVLRDTLTGARKVILACRYGRLTIRGDLQEVNPGFESLLQGEE
jgi:membrane protease subunit HflK